LIFIEIDAPLLEELLQNSRKKWINEMSCFLANINIFISLSSDRLDYLSSKA